VHDFIAQARRLRDLWAGSFLLSWLSGNAMAGALDAELGSTGEIRGLLAPRLDRAASPQSVAAVDPMLAAIRNHAPVGFPNPRFGSLTNQFAVHLEVAAGEDAGSAIAVVGAAAREKMQSAWRGLSAQVWETFIAAPWRACGDEHRRAVLEVWAGQTGHVPEDDAADGVKRGCFFELIWAAAAVPAGVSPAEVAASSPALRLRKLWRTHAPPPDRETAVDRCRLIAGWPELSARGDGERDAQRAFWRAVAEEVHRRIYKAEARRDDWPTLEVAEDERLSPTAVVRRLFPGLDRDGLHAAFGWVPGERDAADDPKLASRRLRIWPSTAFVAASRWLGLAASSDATVTAAASYHSAIAGGLHEAYRRAEEITAPKIAPLRRQQCERPELQRFHALDGQLFFERGVVRPHQRLGRNAADPDSVIAERRAAHHALLRTMDREGFSGREPSNFYALLRVDGDELGRHFADHPTAAPQLSDALSRFVRGLDRLVSRHYGITVFAGGDEMLAVLPVETAISVAMLVRCKFRRAMAPLTDVLDREPTLSAAILFADYQLPLSLAVRETTGLLESRAKEGNGRNSIAIAVHRTPEPDFVWVSAWETVRNALEEGADLSPVRALHDLARDVIATGDVGRSWMHRLRSKLTPVLDAHPEGVEDRGGASGDRLDGAALKSLILAELRRDATRRPRAERLETLATKLAASTCLRRGDSAPLKAPPPAEAAEAEPAGWFQRLSAFIARLRLDPAPTPPSDAPAPAPAALTDDEPVHGLWSLQLFDFLLREYHPGIVRADVSCPRSS